MSAAYPLSVVAVPPYSFPTDSKSFAKSLLENLSEDDRYQSIISNLQNNSNPIQD